MSPVTWIDSHCHLDAPEFDADRAAQREQARQLGVQTCVIPAVHPDNWHAVQALAHHHHDLYALGIHPLYVQACEAPDLAALQHQLQTHHSDAALVAVGEIGLDAFEGHPDVQVQRTFFRAQLQFARELNLPVILHVRRAVDEVLKELRRCPVRGGIAHAFNGSLQQAHMFLDLGFALGFGGAISFDRALRLRELARSLPLHALVLETDAPDIPPHWLYRTAQQRAMGQAQGRNSPTELPRIAQVCADLRGMDVHDLAQACGHNTQRALRWPSHERWACSA
jgi:TatD DNase family protein